MKISTAILILSFMIQQPSFRETQKKNARVRTAYEEKEAIIKKMFEQKKLNYAGFHMFIRGFKKEEKLEVWIRQKGSNTFNLLHTYDFCSSSGVLGPKRKEGDLQIPEGIYEINHFNPASNFYLSLGINYPNTSDKILSDKKQPGGNIYIHGNCVTIGCIPITDDKIKELYLIAVEARNNGQENIPVHIFPTRLDEAGWKGLTNSYADAPALITFWGNLKAIFQDFESTQQLKKVRVGADGAYGF